MYITNYVLLIISKTIKGHGKKDNLLFNEHSTVQESSIIFYPFVGINLVKKGVLYSEKVISYVETRMFFDLEESDPKAEQS